MRKQLYGAGSSRRAGIGTLGLFSGIVAAAMGRDNAKIATGGPAAPVTRKAWKGLRNNRPHQGEREKARRRRQMAAGQLAVRCV